MSILGNLRRGVGRSFELLLKCTDDAMLQMQKRKDAKAKCKKALLTDAQKGEIRAFYQPYARVSTVFHEMYYERTGVYSPAYVPEDLYFNRVTRHFNDRKKAAVLGNKCLLSRLFPEQKQPVTIVQCVNGYWFDGQMRLLEKAEVERRIVAEPEVVVKQAAESGGGYGVRFVSGAGGDMAAEFWDVCAHMSKNIIVQKPLKQHQQISRLAPNSVNSIRAITMMTEEGAVFVSAVLRVGRGEARIDNASQGGLACGIGPDGRLKPVAYNTVDEVFTHHPTTGVAFADVVIPNYDRLVADVCRMQAQQPYSRLISWDMSIDTEGDPVLIEANMSIGGIRIHQLCNGPLFGDNTRQVLDEVFQRGRK